MARHRPDPETERLAALLDVTGKGGRRGRQADLAAVLGGAIVGYRSLWTAAGLPLHRDVLAEALLEGIPRAMSRLA